MSDMTPILGIPLLSEAQASAEIVVNESLTRLDALAQIAVKDRDLATPPGSPAVGDTYLIATSGTAAWSGHDNDLAVYASGWLFTDVKPGMLVYVRDENKLILRSDSSTWIDITPVGLATETANTVYAGPTTSPSATPSFRALVADDVPNLDTAKITTGILSYARGGTGAGSYTTGGVVFAGGSALTTDGNFAWDNTNKRLAIGTYFVASSNRLAVTESTGVSNSVPALGFGGATFAVLADGGQYGLLAGATGAGDGYLQVQRTDGTATAYNLVLQPNGGNIGIGVTPPAGTKLAVDGPIRPKTYTVAGLPTAGTAGRIAYATDACNTGELTGAGTGSLVADSGSLWRIPGMATAVTA